MMRHDREQALERAMHLFWHQGFAATSMKDLEAALHMHPGSIYAAFGSKSGLFREALDLYGARLDADLREALEGAGSVPDGIRAYLDKAVLSQSDGGKACRACLLQKAALELSGGDEALRAHAEHGLAAVRRTLATAIAEGQRKGEVDIQADPDALATFAQVQIMGIMTLAQTRPAVPVMRDTIERAVAAIRGVLDGMGRQERPASPLPREGSTARTAS